MKTVGSFSAHKDLFLRHPSKELLLHAWRAGLGCRGFYHYVQKGLPEIRSTTSVWVDWVTCAPFTFTITSFSRTPARSAAPPGRTVCTDTGRSPDNVRPYPFWSSRFTIKVLVLSLLGDAAFDLLKQSNMCECLVLWISIWKDHIL